MKRFKKVKKIDKEIGIVLFLRIVDADYLYDALALKCSRYFYMKIEKEHILDHFKELLKILLIKVSFSKIPNILMPL